MARFIQVPTFDIYDEEIGQWAPPDEWWTDGQLIYQSDILDKDGEPILVTVHDRFLTDLASIPKFPPGLRTLFIRNGKHRIAAVVHDYLCRRKSFPRVLADKIFLEAMALREVGKIKRTLMYWAVRANTAILKLIGKAP